MHKVFERVSHAASPSGGVVSAATAASIRCTVLGGSPKKTSGWKPALKVAHLFK